MEDDRTVSVADAESFRKKLDLLLMTVTAVETAALRSAMRPLPGEQTLLRVHVGASTFTVGQFGAFGSVHLQSEMGSTGRDSVILALSEAITSWQPKAVIMIGIAFGAWPDKQALGDVLVGRSVALYEPARIGSSTVQRGPIAESGPVLYNRFRNAAAWRHQFPSGNIARTWHGLVVSGEKLVDSGGFKRQLLDAYPEAIGGDMEGAGLYAACARAGVEWILVKAICDWADGTKTDSFQQAAAASAVSLSAFVLSDPHCLDSLGARAVATTLQRRSSEGPMHYLHRPERPEHFVGRKVELEDLSNALTVADTCLVGIVGMAGQGKTSLVFEWLLRQRESFPFEIGVWCSAHGQEFTFDAFLDGVLSLVEKSFDKREKTSTQARVAATLNHLSTRRCLVVIDGLEKWLDAESRVGAHEGLDQFLRQASGLVNGTRMLFTSRAIPAVVEDVRWVTVPSSAAGRATLQGLDDTAAVQLLRQQGISDADDLVLAEARRYDNHPLALRVLAALAANEYGGRLSDLPRRAVGAGLKDLLTRISRALPKRRRATRVLSIAATCLEAPTLDMLATVLHADIYPFVWLRKTPDELRNTIVALHQWQLIHWDGAEGVVRLHPLIREFFARRARGARKTQRLIARWYAMRPDARSRRLAIEHALEAGDARWCAALLFAPLGHSHSYLEWIATYGHSEDGLSLLHRLASASRGALRGQFLLAAVYLSHQLSRFRETLQDLQECLRIFQTEGSRPSVNFAKALASRGNVHRMVGHSTDAVADLSRALELLRTVRQNAESPALIAQTLVNRANALLDLGEWNRAIADYDAADEVLRALPPTDANVLQTAALRANRGVAKSYVADTAAALADLGAAIATGVDLCKRGFDEAVPIHLHAQIMTAAVQAHSGSPVESLQRLTEATAELRELVQRGRASLEPLLALAWLNRVTVLLQLQRWSEALVDSEDAFALYRKLIVQDRAEMAGGLAHVQVLRAEARFHLGDATGARADRREAFSAIRQLIVSWQQEADILLVFLHRAVEAANYLSAAEPAESRALAVETLDELERITARLPVAEGLLAQARQATRAIRTANLSDAERIRVAAVERVLDEA